jgi:hypothetical protein
MPCGSSSLLFNPSPFWPGQIFSAAAASNFRYCVNHSWERKKYYDGTCNLLLRRRPDFGGTFIRFRDILSGMGDFNNKKVESPVFVAYEN